MSKVIVFQVAQSGTDGRAPETILYSSLCEENRDRWFKESKNNKYYYKKEVIKDTKEMGSDFLSKLNGDDYLVLSYCLGYDKGDSLSCPFGDINLIFKGY